MDAGRRIPFAALGHGELSHAAQPSRIFPRHAGDSHRAASGLSGQHAARMVGKPARGGTDRRRISEISLGSDPPSAGRDRGPDRGAGLVIVLRSILFNLSFYAMTSILCILAL